MTKGCKSKAADAFAAQVASGASPCTGDQPQQASLLMLPAVRHAQSELHTSLTYYQEPAKMVDTRQVPATGTGALDWPKAGVEAVAPW